ncbi:hypothetical protein [Glycomyces buryatensis]|uniref:Uncharacterized protein n=1 Tax=Glycomyces buryatensis TaxID=2570927 RepID=A0A4S8Q8S4_9ACTN|nr:hypothetical protein [Glycomyces buryatensis]THV40803.1 hypothetical protein FAB82_14235 [Glycomyces buryatensis]
MSTNYEFNTASYSVEEISDFFCTVLDLDRVKLLAPSPITGEKWWAAATVMEVAEFTDEGRRLQATDTFTSISFEPRKSMNFEDENRGLARIIKSVLDLLSRDNSSSGFLEFYDEIIVIEKRKGQEIVVDPRLIDPNDLDAQNMFAPILKGYIIEPIDQF